MVCCVQNCLVRWATVVGVAKLLSFMPHPIWESWWWMCRAWKERGKETNKWNPPIQIVENCGKIHSSEACMYPPPPLHLCSVVSLSELLKIIGLWKPGSCKRNVYKGSKGGVSSTASRWHSESCPVFGTRGGGWGISLTSKHLQDFQALQFIFQGSDAKCGFAKINIFILPSPSHPPICIFSITGNTEKQTFEFYANIFKFVSA